jgi:isopenicillin N synthase-like dioxygenase
VVGDMMQYITNSFLVSTPHKVGLNLRERFAFAYFHEPNFSSVVKPLEEFSDLTRNKGDGIHYGTHFTNMFLRSYPNRITSRRIMEEKRMDILQRL